jgi:CheY-like chemotaxis protein
LDTTPSGSGQALQRAEEGGRVLIVDDHADAAQLEAHLLGRLGFEVRVAHDGRAAIEMTRHFRPDVILLDIAMPEVDGFEVARTLKNEPELAHVRIVAISGYDVSKFPEREPHVCFDAQMMKPIQIAELEQLVRGLQPH